MNMQEMFASAQIISHNPVLQEDRNTQTQYFAYLQWLVHLERWQGREYTGAAIDFYCSRLCDTASSKDLRWGLLLDPGFSYLIPFDLAAVLGFDNNVLSQAKIDAVVRQIIASFGFSYQKWDLFRRLFHAALGEEKAWERLLCDQRLQGFQSYLQKIHENITFIQKAPVSILVTATMSAGKSTLTNALVGKTICRAQNMACTSRIHHIISKPFEDGITSLYDYGLKLNAQKEDLIHTDTEGKFSDTFIGTYFDGFLGGRRLVLLDSPGVNSSENGNHMEVTRKMLYSEDYQYLLYVLNATQLGTEDEAQHLRFIAKETKNKPVLFIMNKIDCLMTGEDSISDAICHQSEFLISVGFQDPLICPVSSKAAFLAKKSQKETLSRLERREVENLADKFELFSLASYYTNNLHCKKLPPAQDEMQRLLQNSGVSYLENMIQYFIERRRHL